MRRRGARLPFRQRAARAAMDARRRPGMAASLGERAGPPMAALSGDRTSGVLAVRRVACFDRCVKLGLAPFVDRIVAQGERSQNAENHRHEDEQRR